MNYNDYYARQAGGALPYFRLRLLSWLMGSTPINIVNAILFANKATLNQTVEMAHIKVLEKSTVKYPMRSVNCKVYSIPAGARSHTHENLFLGILPKRLVLCCIDNDAYNGAYDKNPFHAKNNAINFHAVYVDGRQIPSKPFQHNFVPGRRRTRRLLLLVRSAATTRGVPHFPERTLFRVDS